MPRRRLAPLALILAALAMLIAGCTSDGGDAASSSGPSTSQAPARTFTVTPPSGYREDRSRLSGAIVGFYTGPKVDDFTVNINITRESSKGLSLDEFQTQSVTGLKRTLDVRELSDPAAATVDGERALRYTFEDTQQGVNLKQGQVVVLHDGYGYVLTFTAPALRYDTQEPTATKLISSLRWT